MNTIILCALALCQQADAKSSPDHIQRYLQRCTQASAPSLPLRLPPEKDDIGVLTPALTTKASNDNHRVDVLEVVDGQNAILRAWHPPAGNPTDDPTFTDIWVQGIDTNTFTAETSIKLPSEFHVIGNKLFDTTCGKRSLPLLEPIDLKAYRK